MGGDNRELDVKVLMVEAQVFVIQFSGPSSHTGSHSFGSCPPFPLPHTFYLFYCGLHFYPELEERFLSNVGINLPNYTGSHPRRWYCTCA
jgi:hypothetical protein